jgi:chromosome segregation ATPase
MASVHESIPFIPDKQLSTEPKSTLAIDMSTEEENVATVRNEVLPRTLNSATSCAPNTSTSFVDLDVSIADTEATGASNATTIARFTTIVETAMANFRLHDKDSSKLSKVWLACDENQQISMQEALEAAVTDMMNLQSQLVVAERKIEDYEASELARLATEAALHAQIQELQHELKASKSTVDQHVNGKQRMIANLKKKKSQMEVTEHELAVATKDLKQLSAENSTLRQAVQSATEARDSFKNKLRSQQESVKESRTVIQDLEKRLRKTEQARALECELLDNFRKLAIHTG